MPPVLTLDSSAFYDRGGISAAVKMNYLLPAIIERK
jgi:hypothetical protein